MWGSVASQREGHHRQSVKGKKKKKEGQPGKRRGKEGLVLTKKTISLRFGRGQLGEPKGEGGSLIFAGSETDRLGRKNSKKGETCYG